MAIDIRAQIEQKLMAFSAERYRLQHRLTIVMEIEKELRALLAQQEELKPAPVEIVRQPKIGSTAEDGTNAPAVLAIQRLLQESPKTKEQLAEYLQRDKFGFDDKSPARVVHLTLVNMKRRGLVEQTPTGQWRLHKQAA